MNDQLGHEAGDLALKEMAALLRETVRPTDLVARLGGDEFALWMDNADHMTAAERAEYLCVQGAARVAAAVPSSDPPIGFSIGIATRQSGKGEEVSALLRRSDQAMYHVKQNGRGFWCVAQEQEI